MSKLNLGKWILKFVAAAILAMCIVSGFCYFYYNPEIHVKCDSMATSYTREANTYWSRWTEGIARGTSDENGYNNSFKADYSDFEILMMGSSQTEGLYVNEEDCMSYVLNEMFRNKHLKLKAYNIGMSGHDFCRNINNIENALKNYTPSKYLIIETTTLLYRKNNVYAALNQYLGPLQTYNEGSLLYRVQKNPYVKLAYLQYKNYLLGKQPPIDRSGYIYATEDEMDQLMAYINNIASQYGLQTIIYYIPTLQIDETGSLQAVDELGVSVETGINEDFDYYRKICEDNNIIFLDMSEVFLKEYKDNYTVPAGFPNTEVCYGHLNKYGHRMIAEELYKIIMDLEEMGE